MKLALNTNQEFIAAGSAMDSYITPHMTGTATPLQA